MLTVADRSRDASTRDGGLDADLCIIGAGAAGLTLAQALAGTALRVMLVESGGRLEALADDDLLEGEVEGFPFKGLMHGRVRVFGGSTTLWYGQCIRLSGMDLAPRDWVEHSGWPIAAPEIEPFYEAAERAMGIARPIYDARLWEAFGVPDPGFDPRALAPHFTIYPRRPNLADRFGPAIDAAPNIEVLTGATATALLAGASGEGLRVRGVRLRGRDGAARDLSARWFVLCCGGIENPRLLLASRDGAPEGLGNRGGAVGRFLQDHPSGRTALVLPARPRALQEIFAHRRRRGLRFWPKLELSPERQRRHRVLNANGYLVYDYPAGSSVHALKALFGWQDGGEPGRLDRAARLLRLLRDAPWLSVEAARAVRGRRMPIFPPERIWLQAFTEQRPDPANRVRLSERRDRFGVPQARVEWRLGEMERRTLEVFTDAVAAEFERLGLGRLVVQDWLRAAPDDLAEHVDDAYHHAGTTRMSLDPRSGVVDPDGRVHDTTNLFVLGSSTFPTSGYANPTLTIMALALRLAERVKAGMPLPRPAGAPALRAQGAAWALGPRA